MPKSNNSINNTVGALTPGQTNTLTVQNKGTGAATLNLKSGAATTNGNIWTQYTIGTTRSYAMGTAQNGSTTPPFVISTNTGNTVDPSTGTQNWSMNTNGGLTLTTQPCFMYYYNGNLPITTGSKWIGVTGDGTNYLVGSGPPSGVTSSPGFTMTKVFDLGNNFNSSTGVFTAPIAGIYFFVANVTIANLNRNEQLAQLEIGRVPLPAPPPSPTNPSEQWLLDLFAPFSSYNGGSACIEAGGDSVPVNGSSQITLMNMGYHSLAAGDMVGSFILVAGGTPPAGYTQQYVACLANGPQGGVGSDYLTYFAGYLVA